MPTYRYDCISHGEFEHRFSIYEDSKFCDCPQCGMRSPKVFVTPQISPRISEHHLRDAQTKPSAASSGNRNSWEAGRVKSRTGAPLLDENFHEIPVKKYAANRSRYEERRRFLETHPDPFGAKAEQARKDGR